MRSKIFATVVAGMAMAGAALAADWPSFRGTRGGVADDSEIPVKWDTGTVQWKKKLPGPGASSPITYGDRVFVTSYSGYGTKLSSGIKGGGKKGGFSGPGGGGDVGAEQKKLRYHLQAFDRKSGNLLWEKIVEPKLPEMPASGFITEHGYTSSTPVTDGERVYAFFGKTGVVAFDMKGTQLWQKSVGEGTDGWGSASSPIVVDDLVVVNAAIESGSLVALDAKTGDVRWRTKGMSKSWSSPVLVETKDGKQEIVVSLAGKIIGYDPKTGDELWRCQGIGGAGGGGKGGGYTSSTPVTRDGVVYATGGGGPNPTMTVAVKAGGRGEVDASHVLWRKSVGTGISSPILVGNKLVWVSGSLTALDVKDGSTVAQERLYEARSEYVSPVALGDKIYALTRTSGLYVLNAGDKFGELAHNEFPGDTSAFNASPAVSEGQMFVRSNEYLYAIGKK